MTESACKGCGTPLVQARTGRPREWCSERCRKVTLYSRKCACGATINVDGSVRDAATRCRACRAEHHRAAGGRADRALEMMRMRCEEGLSNRQIAAIIGLSHMSVRSELHRLRVLGFDVPADGYNNIPLTGAHVLDEPGRALGRELAARGIHPPGARAAA